MAGQANNYGTIHSFLASGAVTANRALKLTAANTVAHTTAITDDVIGVALNTAADGEYVEVQCGSGVKQKMVASAAIAAGAQVMPTAAGAGKVSTASGATAKSVGSALSAAAADGEVIEVLLRARVNGPANT